MTVLNKDNWGGANAGNSSVDAYVWMAALTVPTGVEVVALIGNGVNLNPPWPIATVGCTLVLVFPALFWQLTKMSLLEKRARRAM